MQEDENFLRSAIMYSLKLYWVCLSETVKNKRVYDLHD